MFGYLRIDKDELKVKDYRFYKSVYCGLCRSMGKNYGTAARLMLSYDCTVLAVLLMSVTSEKCAVVRKRCPVNPLKKCEFCDCMSDAIKFAGAVSVILGYNRLQDTIIDSKMLKKIPPMILKILLKRNYRKAAAAYPEIAHMTEQLIKMQTEAESKKAGIDASAEPTAKFMSKLCSMFCPQNYNSHAAETFGYYIGRWIYLIDAADDLEEDIKKGTFNPFKEKYNGDTAETMKYCNEVLNMTAAHITMSYDLLDTGLYKSILDNIVYDGIAKQQQYCLFDKYNEKNKKIRSR